VTRLTAALLCLAAIACGRAEKTTPDPAAKGDAPIPKYSTAIEPEYDSDNLLNLAYGAAVVSRTGELTLESSAVHAIDGTINTGWSSPPGTAHETLVFALASLSRITRVGVTNVESDGAAPTAVAFEVSEDGARWRPLIRFATTGGKEPQLRDVPPVNARYLRVMTEGREMAVIRSIHAIGREIEPVPPRSIAGCWRINELPARFVQDGATVTGIIAADPPLLLEGGSDGRVAQFVWTEGPMWGHAVITATQNGATLSGLKIHEEISTQQYGDGWFGERIPCDGIALAPPIPGSLRPRAPNERWTMYGLVFDAQDRVDENQSRAALEALARRLAVQPSQRFRITAHELREADPGENRKSTDARIASLRAALQSRGVDMARIELVSAGSEWTEPPIATALQRRMASRVDLDRHGRQR
jgi:hypothetical protein